MLLSFCIENDRTVSTCEQHASSEHLSQDAASGPHVDGLGVVVGGQEETRGAVPLGHQTLGQIALSGVQVQEKEEDTAEVEVVRVVGELDTSRRARRLVPDMLGSLRARSRVQ